MKGLVPGTQGTDASGKFPVGTTVTGPFGQGAPLPRNVLIESAGPSVKLAADFF